MTGLFWILPTKVSAFCILPLIVISCYILPRTPKPVANTGFRGYDITPDNTTQHDIKTHTPRRVSRVRTPDGVPSKICSFNRNLHIFFISCSLLIRIIIQITFQFFSGLLRDLTAGIHHFICRFIKFRTYYIVRLINHHNLDRILI